MAANLTLNDTTLNVSSWLAFSRGNGSTETVCNVTLTNSTLNAANFSTGYDGQLGNNDVTTNFTLNDSTFTITGDNNYLAESLNATANITLNGASSYNAPRMLLGMGVGAEATLTLNDTSALNMGNSWFSIGAGNNSADPETCTGTIVMNNSSTLTNQGGDFNIGDVNNATGILTINDSGTATHQGDATVFVGKNNCDGFLNIQGAGASFNTTSVVTVGNHAESTGTITITAGSLNLNGDDGDDSLLVGNEGQGTLNVSGTGTANLSGTSTLVIGNVAGSNGIVNLDPGGTISTSGVTTNAGTGTLNFGGGTLLATASNANFLNVTTVDVAGGTIDTNGFDVTVVSPLGGTGDLTKSGTGTLTLQGVNTNTGTFLTSAGNVTSLAIDTFADASTVAITTGATMALDYSGEDTIHEFIVDGTAQGPGVYNATTHPGLLTGTGSLRVVPFTGGTPYDNWIDSFFPGETDLNIIDPEADPDGDGQANKFEFAFGGIPNDASSGAIICQVMADSDADADSDAELLLTVAVRSGAPAFSGAPSPTSEHDGCTYTIQGSLDLQDFTSNVTVVPTAVTTGLPALPAGYEYRSFSLDASNGLTGKGFLRAQALETP